MKRIHYWIGVLGIIAFVLTGQYMDIYHNHLIDMEDGPRMLYRSSHIYFLLASIINLATSFNYAVIEGKLRYLQHIASLLILLSPVLLLIGFFIEPGLSDLHRPYSRTGIYGLFGSGVLLAILSFKQSNK